MATLTNAELVAAVAALEWVANRADLATVLNRFMQAEKKPPTVTKKMLAKAANFLKSQNGEAAQTARIARGMKIKEWLRTGELEGTERDTRELLKVLGGMLDSVSVDAIVGPNLFQGSDGRYYTVVVEAVIEEASDDFVQDVLQELYEEGEDDGEESDVLGTVIRGEKNGQPYPPAEDPDTRSHPRLGPPPGKPLAEVLDTSDTPPLRIADILDRVEAEAVAGADAETIAARDKILAIARAAVESKVDAGDVTEAWEEYGGWHLPALKDAHRSARDAPLDEDDRTDAYRTAIVIALREAGVISLDDLELAAKLEERKLLDIAAEFRGQDAEQDAASLRDQIREAWGKYATWELPTLRNELETTKAAFAAAGGRGVALADVIDTMGLAVALREAGVTSIAALTEEG